MVGTLQARRRGIDAGLPAVEVMYFTDPYCSWCWATEPVWLRLQEEFGDQVHFRTVMGGLVERAGRALGDRPRIEWLRQHVVEVAARSGQPIDPAFLDQVDESFSTWPACIHVKAAELQAEDYGHRFLRGLRKGIMLQQTRASDPLEVVQLAEAVEGLDPMEWTSSLADGSALQAFLDDRRTCVAAGVSGFPTLLLRSTEVPEPRSVVGYQHYEAVRAVLMDVAPWLVARPPRDVVDLLFDHGPMTTREIQEIHGMSPAEAFQMLDGLAMDGQIERDAGDRFWRLPGAD